MTFFKVDSALYISYATTEEPGCVTDGASTGRIRLHWDNLYWDIFGPTNWLSAFPFLLFAVTGSVDPPVALLLTH